MKYVCFCCGYEIKDIVPCTSFPKFMILLDSPNRPRKFGDGKCPECGALLVPECDWSSTEVQAYFKLMSNCPNAYNCIDENDCYRPQCEALEFSPACLTFLWRELYEIKKAVMKAHKLSEEDLDEPPDVG